jgi:SAM-dependent methyltransferase
MAWVGATLTQADIRGRTVLEVGSYDVNGTVRPLVEALHPASYLGVDQAPGPNVDQVVSAEHLVETFGADRFDVVVATELLEHAEDWRACLRGMAEVLKPGGLLLLTTRSPGFPRHNFPSDHWRFTVPLMREILVALGLSSHELRPDPDPKSPGVLVKARKSDPWRWDPAALAELDAAPAP